MDDIKTVNLVIVCIFVLILAFIFKDCGCSVKFKDPPIGGRAKLETEELKRIKPEEAHRDTVIMVGRK